LTADLKTPTLSHINFVCGPNVGILARSLM